MIYLQIRKVFISVCLQIIISLVSINYQTKLILLFLSNPPIWPILINLKSTSLSQKSSTALNTETSMPSSVDTSTVPVLICVRRPLVLTDTFTRKTKESWSCTSSILRSTQGSLLNFRECWQKKISRPKLKCSNLSLMISSPRWSAFLRNTSNSNTERKHSIRK